MMTSATTMSVAGANDVSSGGEHDEDHALTRVGTSPTAVPELHRVRVGAGAKSRHVHELEEPANDEGQPRDDRQHVDAALADHVETEGSAK